MAGKSAAKANAKKPSVGQAVVSKILQKAKAVGSSASRTYHGKETGYTLSNFCQWLFTENETDRHSEATLLSVLIAEFSGNEDFDSAVAKQGSSYLHTLRNRYNYGILASTKTRKAPSVFSVPYGDDKLPVTTRGNALKLSNYLKMVAKRGYGVTVDGNSFTILPDSLVNRDLVKELLNDENRKDCEVSFEKAGKKPVAKKAAKRKS